jgi:TATA-box binding protein (TBP) (component of TFIID and TFIIIB)
VLSKIFIELKTVKGIIDKETITIVDKPFINDSSKLELEFVNNITIGMINSNFVYPNKIDRLKLFNLLNLEQKECRYDPSNHAPVNIKYNCKDKSISIFVFEKGSILITGAKNCEHILEGYEFINKYLLTNHKKIVKSSINMTNIDSLLENKIKIKKVNKYKKQQDFNSDKSDNSDLEEDEIEQAFKLLIKS